MCVSRFWVDSFSMCCCSTWIPLLVGAGYVSTQTSSFGCQYISCAIFPLIFWYSSFLVLAGVPIRAREASEFFIKKYKISCKHSQEISRFRLVKSCTLVWVNSQIQFCSERMCKLKVIRKCACFSWSQVARYGFQNWTWLVSVCNTISLFFTSWTP